ncbi:esterase/lipase family protein [Moraxella cuniculi]|uniref:Alpha/beta hydrolase family n=1 Tax=Moraxella cuniculi TaxID=34061 RepID=A0A448GYA8_9GAMM|nr:alpha/beta hydrolase [Moraxella cuniculi]VEG13681.1 Alpha/beta hydrolase family [Moraxella cuniculi]
MAQFISPLTAKIMAALFITATTAGCSTLQAPKQSPAKLLQETRSSIITDNEVSAATRSTLLSSGFNQESCMATFDSCIDAVKSSFLDDKVSKPMLAVLSELYYTRTLYLALQDGCKTLLDRPPIDPYYTNAPLSEANKKEKQNAQNQCQSDYRDALYQTVRNSYAYLFFDALNNNTQTISPIPQEMDIRTLDFYHLAINEIISQLYRADKGIFAAAKLRHHSLNTPSIEPKYQQVQLSTLISQENGTDNQLDLSISNYPYYLEYLKKSDGEVFSELVSAYDSRLSKLNVYSRRSGLGVSFIGSLKSRYTANSLDRRANKPIAERIHTTGHLQVTAIIEPTGNSLDEVLNSNRFGVYLFNPQAQTQITIKGRPYPLAANFSASYALWLNENRLQQLSLMNMVSKGDAMALPELFMLKPFDPNQKVIIMLHGLASSPATWVNLTNNLLADPKLNDAYQVWQIAYSTNLPILENRYQINQLIRQAFASVDPDGTTAASRNAILIGHSMGGVISRLLVSDDNLNQYLDQLSDGEQDKLFSKLSIDQKQLLDERLALSTLPQVDTAIFLSAPFRGTDYADRWFTRAARRIIRLPVDLTKTVNAAISEGNQSVLGALYLQNGASQLSDRSAFMTLTKDVTISPKVRYHTLVGNNKANTDSAADAVGAAISDGIVPYSSSHLAGASSETIIAGKHNIHESPETIAQLRKILYEHLAKR